MEPIPSQPLEIASAKPDASSDGAPDDAAVAPVAEAEPSPSDSGAMGIEVPPAEGAVERLTARLLNEFVYCPRLF